MRVVLDTNVVVSAFAWDGKPEAVIAAALAGHFDLWTSRELVAELTTVLSRPKFALPIAKMATTVAQFVMDYQSKCTLVFAPPLPAPVCADPDDDAVLACAVAAKADTIVSGDRHVLSLGAYNGIPILTAADMLAQLPPP